MAEEIRIIVQDNFIEDEYVIVNIDGDVVRRKVYYSAEAKDLYVLHKGAKYFYSEFTTEEVTE